jgi:hypothetical protein
MGKQTVGQQGVRHRLTPHSLLLSAWTALVAGHAHGALVDTFKAEYPAAVSRLESAYSHITLVTDETRFDDVGRFLWTERTEYKRDGDLVRAVKTTLRSASPKVNAGTVAAFGGGRSKHFQIQKAQGVDHFVITAFGANPEFDAAARMRCVPLFAPFCTMDQKVADYLSQGNVKVVSAEMSHLETTQEVVHVTTEELTAEHEVRRGQFFFLPHSLALAGWSVPFRGEKQPGTPEPGWQCRVQYEPDSDPPKLKAVECYVNHPTRPSQQGARRRAEVRTILFGPVAQTEFTLAAFGMDEPVTPSNNSRVVWLILINGLLLAGAVFYILSRRHRRPAGHVA